MAEFDPQTFVRAVAAYRLEGSSLRLPDRVPQEHWRNALVTMTAERLTGLAVQAVEDGALELTDVQWDELLERHRRAMAWCLGLEARLLQVADALDAADVPFLVLKGPVLAHTVYPNPSWRPFGDIDILVKTKDWRRACAVFEEGFGWPRRMPEPRRGFDERFGKSAVFETEQGQEIDLHRNLAQGPFGQWIRAEDLFDRISQLEVGSRVFPIPDPVGRLLHGVIHAVLGSATSPLLALRDVIGAGLCLDTELDAFRLLASRWSVRPVVAIANDRARLQLGHGGATWMSQAGSGSRERKALRALSAHTKSDGRHAAMQLAMIRSISGWRSKLKYIGDVVAPGRPFMLVRSGGGSYLRRWRIPIGWIRARGSR
jgi:hypothetical protein